MSLTDFLAAAAAARKWLDLWGMGGFFNCTTLTFDLGCFNCNAGDIFIAPRPQPPYIIRERFLAHSSCGLVDISKSEGQNLDLGFTAVRPYWSGPWIHVLHIICENLQLRCKIKEPGTPTDETGLFGGSQVLHDLQTGVARIGLSSLTLSPSRVNSDNYSFIASPKNKTYSIVVHKEFLTESSTVFEDIILRSFGTDTIICATIFALFLFIIIHVSQNLTQPAAGNAISVFLPQFFNTFVVVVSGCLDPLRARSPYSTSVCLVTLFCLMSTFQTIFVSVFPAEMTMNNGAIVPFSSIEQLLASDFEVHGGDAIKELLLDSKESSFRALGERLIAQTDSRSYYEFIATQGATTRKAFLVHSDGLWDLANVSCDFVVAVENVRTVSVGAFWFRRSDQLLFHNFTKLFEKLSFVGIINFDLQYFSRYASTKLREQHKIEQICVPQRPKSRLARGRRALGMEDFKTLYIFVLAVNGAAVLVMLVERLFPRLTKKRHTD